MKNFKTCSETITSEECEYFRELEKLHSKYPLNPVILNCLANGYEHLKQTEKARSLIFETCEKFPDYLFARTAKAKLLLKEGKPIEAFEAIDNALTIKRLYPHRDVFHTSEVKVFEDVLVMYFFFMQDLEQAEYHLKIIEKIAYRYSDEVIFYFDHVGNKYVASGGSLAWRLNNSGLLYSHIRKLISLYASLVPI